VLSHEEQFPIGTRVRLRDGVDPSLYNGFSRPGNEGWIRKRKRDKYGYPQVYIEFDKDHWAYNGTEDGWTWQGQFEAVEEIEMAEQPNKKQEELEETVKGITENFVQAIFGAMGSPVEKAQDTSTQLSPSDDILEPEDNPDTWESLIAEAGESLTKSPAYLLITLEHMEVANAPAMIIPRVFHASREHEYALIIQSQLAHVLASFQDTTIAAVLNQGVNKRQVTSEDA
jgi:hypothetical protein